MKMSGTTRWMRFEAKSKSFISKWSTCRSAAQSTHVSHFELNKLTTLILRCKRYLFSTLQCWGHGEHLVVKEVGTLENHSVNVAWCSCWIYTVHTVGCWCMHSGTRPYFLITRRRPPQRQPAMCGRNLMMRISAPLNVLPWLPLPSSWPMLPLPIPSPRRLSLIHIWRCRRS